MAKKSGGMVPLLLVGGAILLMSGSSKAKASAAPSLPEPITPEAPIATLAKQLAQSVRTKAYSYDRALCAEFQAAAKIDADGLYGPQTAAAVARYTAAPAGLFRGAKAAAMRDVASAAVQAFARTQGATGFAPSVADDELAGDDDDEEIGPPPGDDSPIPPEVAPLELVPNTISASVAPSGGAQSTPKPSSIPAGYDPQTARRSARPLAAHLKRAGKAGYDRRLLEQWQRAAGLVPDRVYAGGTRAALLYYGVKPIDAPPPFFPPFETRAFVPPEKR
jgi:hypothetical protein